jgi:hypothetical protein
MNFVHVLRMLLIFRSNRLIFARVLLKIKLCWSYEFTFRIWYDRYLFTLINVLLCTTVSPKNGRLMFRMRGIERVTVAEDFQWRIISLFLERHFLQSQLSMAVLTVSNCWKNNSVQQIFAFRSLWNWTLGFWMYYSMTLLYSLRWCLPRYESIYISLEMSYFRRVILYVCNFSLSGDQALFLKC